jgi:5-methyltetrahydropteroyltriglutamate--homocysteine methyltransferase
MTERKPPFRADHVGSLLRPAALKDARARHARGELDAAALREIEDREIARVIARQEAVGLQAVTDGELRRAWWHWDFLQGLTGVETSVAPAIQFKGASTAPLLLKVTGKLDFVGHPMLDHFAFVQRHARATPKITIPSPSMLVSVTRDWRSIVSRDVYADLDEFYHDLGLAYRKAIRAFADAGCRYLQLDDCNLAFLCDPAYQQKARERGDDPAALMRSFATLINLALADRPPGLAITMHSCRGNLRSTWLTEGGWEPVADLLFNTIGVDGYFLEYDTDRAGDFAPLALVPKGKTVVLGLLSSKIGALEGKDAIRRRIDAAAAYIDHDSIALSPQCGFASSEEGNLLSEEQQWDKLAAVVAIAHEVWPR